jgi:hypothetical protein
MHVVNRDCSGQCNVGIQVGNAAAPHDATPLVVRPRTRNLIKDLVLLVLGSSTSRSRFVFGSPHFLPFCLHHRIVPSILRRPYWQLTAFAAPLGPFWLPLTCDMRKCGVLALVQHRICHLPFASRLMSQTNRHQPYPTCLDGL